MPEYIDREALAQRIVNEKDANAKTRFYESQYGIGYHNGLTMAYSMVLNAPAANVVEVVRCGKCKHYHTDLGWCDIHSHFIDSGGEFCRPWESRDWKMFDEDYFCKDGERKDNG